MNRPFCLSCGCIKESVQRDYCDDCVKSLVEELATLRQRVTELEQDRFTLRQMLHDLAYFSHIVDNTCNPEFEKGYNEAVSAMTASALEYFTCQDLFADDFDKLDDLQIQLTTANEKVRVLREYAEAEEYYFKFDGPSGCKAAEPYDGPCECWKPRLEALNAQRRAVLEATKEREL